MGTPEAGKILSQLLLTGQYQAGKAFKYTANWEMQEPQRSRFVDQYLLQNVSTNLLLELTVQTTTNTDRLDFVLTLRNASEMPLQIPGTAYLGQHLFFRNRLGQFARSGETVRYDGPYFMPMPRGIELMPRQAHRLHIQVAIQPVGKIVGAKHLISPQSTVVLATDDYMFDVKSPGPFEVLAMFEAHGKEENHWAGRVVSKPVRIVIPGPPADK
jgi:hypothetical protein